MKQTTPRWLLGRTWRRLWPYTRTQMDGFTYVHTREMPPHDPEVFNSKGWELHNHLPQHGNTALDIGACTGSYTLRLASRFKKVIAFEPDPENRKWLVKTVRANHAGNITVLPFALGEHDKQAMLWTHPKYKGNSSLIPQHYGVPVDRPVKVEARTLDSFAFNPSLDFAKIDVEGWELQVLKGATRTLERYHPILGVEVHRPSCRGLCDVCQYLETVGYGIVQVGRYDLGTPVHWIIAS